LKKICENCRIEFETTDNRKIYCNRKCKTNHYNKTHKDQIRNYTKEYLKEYRKNNKEKIKKNKKIYALNHKEEIRERQKKHRLENIDKIKLRDNEYYRTHKEQSAISAKKRILKFKLKWYSGLFCDFCGSKGPLDFHHVNSENKKHEIAKMKHKDSLEILSEMSKCIVLCHGCHSSHHHRLRRKKQCVF